MNAFSNALFQGAALDIVVYCATTLCMGAAITGLAALVVRCWKPLDAATRYAVWCVALVAVVVGPLVTTVAMQRAPSAPSADQLAAALRAATHSGMPAKVVLLVPKPAIAIPAPVADVAAALWLLVVLGGSARFVAGVVVLARLKRDALPLSPERRAALPLWRAHAAAPNARRARLCVSDRVEVPVAVGLFDGMVVLPRHVLDDFEPGDVDRFVLHELAHLERRDDWTAIFQRLAQVLLFFNPFVHLVARRLDLEREIACDDRVVAATSDVRSYAVGLTRMAESTAWPHAALAAPAIFVTRRQLSLRVEELLARRRFTAPRVALAPAAVAFAASLGLVAAATACSPTIGVAGLPALPRGALTHVEEKVFVLDRYSGKKPASPNAPHTILLRTDTKVSGPNPVLDRVDAKNIEAILEQLKAERGKSPHRVVGAIEYRLIP